MTEILKQRMALLLLNYLLRFESTLTTRWQVVTCPNQETTVSEQRSQLTLRGLDAVRLRSQPLRLSNDSVINP
jgi:hypothetical protein